MHGYIQNYIRTVLIKTPENRLASHFNICAFAHDYSILINIFCLQKIKLFLELTQNYKSLKIWRKMSRKISKNIARQSKTLYEQHFISETFGFNGQNYLFKLSKTIKL